MSLSIDFSEVWAVPGENHIIDMINPETGLTAVYAKDAETVLRDNPNAVRMKWEDWRKAASERQQTPIRWEPSTYAKYREMLEVLPPAFWRWGLFLVGEPYDHDFATGQPRFQAYRKRGSDSCGYRYYVSSRPITVMEARAEVLR